MKKKDEFFIWIPIRLYIQHLMSKFKKFIDPINSIVTTFLSAIRIHNVVVCVQCFSTEILINLG